MNSDEIQGPSTTISQAAVGGTAVGSLIVAILAFFLGAPLSVAVALGAFFFSAIFCLIFLGAWRELSEAYDRTNSIIRRLEKSISEEVEHELKQLSVENRIDESKDDIKTLKNELDTIQLKEQKYSSAFDEYQNEVEKVQGTIDRIIYYLTYDFDIIEQSEQWCQIVKESDEYQDRNYWSSDIKVLEIEISRAHDFQDLINRRKKEYEDGLDIDDLIEFNRMFRANANTLLSIESTYRRYSIDKGLENYNAQND